MDIQILVVDDVVIKQEGLISVCNLCLSNDRALSTLKDNVDLFIYLLGPQDCAVDPDCVFLCWECAAILKKMRNFQYQVQHAQIVLQQFLYQKDIPLKSLSNLSKAELQNVNYVFHFQENFQENEPDDVKLVHNVEYLEETDLEYSNNETELIGVTGNDQNLTDDEELFKCLKEDPDYEPSESESLNYEPDVPEPELTNIKTENCTEKPKTKKGSLEKYAKLTKNTNLDKNKYESYFIESVLDESDVEKMGKIAVCNNIKKYKRRAHFYNYCAPCRKRFDTVLDLRRHNTYSHVLKEESGPYYCLQCREHCPDEDTLRDHWRQHHNKAIRCIICTMAGFPSPDSMRNHVESHTDLWTCKLCPDIKAVFSSCAEFEYHYRSIHSKYVCDYCGRESTTKSAVLKHIRLKHRSPVCMACNKQFKNSSLLRRHNLYMHPEVEDRKVNPDLTYCVECNKRFPSEAKYRLHLATTVAHNPALANSRRNIVPCPDCGKQFTRTTYMNNHYKQVHRKESKHYCAICDKYLITAWSMKTHVLSVHQKIRKPKNKICDLCGRAFRTNAVLEKHRRTHTGERPYKCAHCPAAFTQNCALKSHTRTQHKILL